MGRHGRAYRDADEDDFQRGYRLGNRDGYEAGKAEAAAPVLDMAWMVDTLGRTEPKDYARMWLDGGGDPTFDQIDGFLFRHFNARAVHVEAAAPSAEAPTALDEQQIVLRDGQPALRGRWSAEDALESLRLLFDVLERLDPVADIQQGEPYVQITKALWKDMVRPAIRNVRAALASEPKP